MVLPPVDLFEYQKRQSDDIFGLNARIGLRYDTIAALNAAPSTIAFDEKRRVLIPSSDGLFLNRSPRGELEEVMLSTRIADGKSRNRS